MTSHKILGVKFNDLSLSTLMGKVEEAISQDRKTILAFSNPEFLLNARSSPELTNYLNDSDYNLADGIGIVIAQRILCGGKPIQRVTGTDFTNEMVRLADKNKYSVVFYGGTEEVALKIRTLLRKDYPGINVIAVENGFQDIEGENNVIKMIYDNEPNVIMVCLGNPRQELWISKHLGDLKKGVIYGNGGAMDFLSANVPRAPQVMRNMGLEWIYRLIQDPSISRIKRQLRLLTFLRILFFAKSNVN